MSKSITRRKFFKNSVLSATCISLGSNLPALSESMYPDSSRYNIMKEVMKYRKLNSHEHVPFNSNPDSLIDAADRLGMEKVVISRPISAESNQLATPQEFKECNDLVLKAIKKHPGRFLGQVFINPIYRKESLEEITRCTDQGMTGLKIYNQVKINDPLFYPIIEKFIYLKMIILVHAHCGLGVGGQRTKYGNIQPNASIPEDFTEAAKRYPEAIFQYAHLGGGGDWEYACKALRNYPNVYADTSGSNNAGNMVDIALEYLGEDRLLFGTDGSYYQGVGVILSSKLNDVQKRKIFFENYNNILKKSGNEID